MVRQHKAVHLGKKSVFLQLCQRRRPCVFVYFRPRIWDLSPFYWAHTNPCRITKRHQHVQGASVTSLRFDRSLQSINTNYTSILRKLVNSSFTVQWRGTEFGIGRKRNRNILGIQGKPPHSRYKLFRSAETSLLPVPHFCHPETVPPKCLSRLHLTTFYKTTSSPLWQFTSAKQTQQLREQLKKRVLRERGRLPFLGKRNKSIGQKETLTAFHRDSPTQSWGCVSKASSPQPSACLCFAVIATLREKPTRKPLKNNHPSLPAGNWSSSDSMASLSNSAWSTKRGREEAPFWSWGSGAVAQVAVLSLVESHPLYVLVARLGKEQSNPLGKSLGALEPHFGVQRTEWGWITTLN